jgi:hypothetical protein
MADFGRIFFARENLCYEDKNSKLTNPKPDIEKSGIEKSDRMGVKLFK